MKVAGLVTLLRLDARRGLGGLLFSAFGIGVGISCLLFFLALSAGVRQNVLQRVFPVGQLQIVPSTHSLGLLGIGGPRALDGAFVAALKARPEVSAVYRRAKIAFAGRVSGGKEIIGKDVFAEFIAEGIDEAALAGDEIGPHPFTSNLGSHHACATDAECTAPEYCPWDSHQCERPVPVVISPFIVELYNGTIAPAHGLPRVNSFIASRLHGITFKVELGRSFFGLGQKAQPIERRLELVGISPHAAQLALTVPLEIAQAWNDRFAPGTKLSSLLVEVQHDRDAAALIRFVESQGYEVADTGAQKASLAIALVTVLLSLVSLSILLLAGANIAQTFFRQVAERRREFSILRALGASAADIRRIVIAEATVAGVIGGVGGAIFCRVLAVIVDVSVARFAPDFPFKPESYFAFHAPLVAGVIAVAIGAAVAGAIGPAIVASRVDPADNL